MMTAPPPGLASAKISITTMGSPPGMIDAPARVRTPPGMASKQNAGMTCLVPSGENIFKVKSKVLECKNKKRQKFYSIWLDSSTNLDMAMEEEKPPREDRMQNRLLSSLTMKNNLQWVRSWSLEELLSFHLIQRHPIDLARYTRVFLKLVTESRERQFSSRATFSQCEKLLLAARFLRFKKDQIIFTEGARCGRWLIVLSGEVQIIAGKQVVATMRKGEWFGEAGFLDKSGKYNCTARAHNECSVIVTSKDLCRHFWEDWIPGINESLDVMQRAPALCGVQRLYCRRILKLSREKRYRPGQMVLLQGAKSPELLLIKSGRVIIWVVPKEKLAPLGRHPSISAIKAVLNSWDAIKLAELGPGEMLGGESMLKPVRTQLCMITACSGRGASGLVCWALPFKYAHDRFFVCPGLMRNLRKQTQMKLAWRTKLIDDTRRGKRRIHKMRKKFKCKLVPARRIATTPSPFGQEEDNNDIMDMDPAEKPRRSRRKGHGRKSPIKSREPIIAGEIEGLPSLVEIESNEPRDESQALLLLQVQAQQMNEEDQKQGILDQADPSSAVHRLGLKLKSRPLSFAVPNTGRFLLHDLQQQRRNPLNSPGSSPTRLTQTAPAGRLSRGAGFDSSPVFNRRRPRTHHGISPASDPQNSRRPGSSQSSLFRGRSEPRINELLSSSQSPSSSQYMRRNIWSSPHNKDPCSAEAHVRRGYSGTGGGSSENSALVEGAPVEPLMILFRSPVARNQLHSPHSGPHSGPSSAPQLQSIRRGLSGSSPSPAIQRLVLPPATGAATTVSPFSAKISGVGTVQHELKEPWKTMPRPGLVQSTRRDMQHDKAKLSRQWVQQWRKKLVDKSAEHAMRS